MKNKSILALFLVQLVFLSCEPTEKEGVKNNSDKNYFDLKYAEALKINNVDADNTILEIIDPNDKKVVHEYKLNNKNGINTPLKTVIPMSATQVGMLDALGLLNTIVAIPSDKYIYSEKLLKKVNNNEIGLVGEFGTSNLESFLKVSPDAIIYSGFDENNPILEKLKKVKIQTIANYEWKENHPLGRAEWIKFFGLLFDENDKADSIFNQVTSNYNSIVDSIKNYAKNRPTVLVGTPYGDQFNVPAGESYMAKILTDLNVDYKYADTEGVGSQTYSLEKIINENKNTDFWLNVAAQNKEDILNLNNKFKLIDAVHSGNVYSYFHNVNKFWEESALRPDLILLDLASIFHPELFEREVLYYYRRVQSGK